MQQVLSAKAGSAWPGFDIRSPLTVFGMFIGLGEVALAYPVTQLHGANQTIIVLFMVTYPFAVLVLFFLLMWSRPGNLYRPRELEKATFDLIQASGDKKLELSSSGKPRAIQRVSNSAKDVRGRLLLWVDDHQENNIWARRMFRSLGLQIDLAWSTAQALRLLRDVRYDLVVSDIDRDGDQLAGIRFLAEIRNPHLLNYSPPLIFYIRRVDPTRPVPEGAVGISDRPDDLLSQVVGVLEKTPRTKSD